MIMMDVRRLHDNCDNSTKSRGKKAFLNCEKKNRATLEVITTPKAQTQLKRCYL